MKPIDLAVKNQRPIELDSTLPERSAKRKVSLVVAAYNEGGIIENSLSRLCEFIHSASDMYEFEMIVVNDGSTDNTGALAESFSRKNPEITVYHHIKNKGLGAALQTAFSHTTGDYVVTLDIDLSFSTNHILPLLRKIEETQAKIVIASPTKKGGKMSHVPWYRRILSYSANIFLSSFTRGKVSNLTSMARVYDGRMIRSLSLRAVGMDIMPEIVYKAMIMHGDIEEIPGHLDWNPAEGTSQKRKSSMKIFSHTIATLFTGFLLRPFLFFILPGALLMLFALYPIVWMFVHFFEEYAAISNLGFWDHASLALEHAYQRHPHTYLVGLFSLLLSIQLIAFGFQSLQNKHYFEELYFLTTKLRRRKDER